MDSPPRDSDLPAGYDEEDPYEDKDIDSFPDWWQSNIREFREFGLRPYRPPRFADGTLVPELVKELERRLGIRIRFRSVNPNVGKDWIIVADGEAVISVKRERRGEGYTLYHIESDEFSRRIREYVDGSGTNE